MDGFLKKEMQITCSAPVICISGIQTAAHLKRLKELLHFRIFSNHCINLALLRNLINSKIKLFFFKVKIYPKEFQGLAIRLQFL